MSCCDKFCSTADTEQCSQKHLTTFCPPVCMKCNPCFSLCDQTFDPISNGVESNFKNSPTNDSNICTNRYEVLKHVIKCPTECSPTICSNIPKRRTNYRPVIRCRCPLTSEVCTLSYETNYMKYYNTPFACCEPSICDKNNIR